MAMSAAQVAAELQRKKSLGIAPTNAANMGQYNKLAPIKPLSASQASVGPKSSGVIPTGTPSTSTFQGTVPSAPGASQTGLAKPVPMTQPAAPTAPTPFMYNPETDPAYQARKRQIEAGAQSATNNAMVSLGSRGIGNSSSAVTAANQIQQQAIGQLNDTVIPQLEQAAYQRYADEQTRQDNLKYQDRQLALQEGQLTGTYLSPEMKVQYDAVLQAKQDYANATTPEARAVARQKADTARAQIVAMGGDPSLVGSDVTLQGAQGNSGRFGVQTQDAIQSAWDRTHTENRDKVTDQQWQDTFDLNSKVTMANLTGYLPDGKPTTAEQQRMLGNLWTAASQTGVIPDQLADMYGIPHGTKTQDAYQFAKNLSLQLYDSQTSRMNAETNAGQLDLDTIKTDMAANGDGNQKTVSPAAAGQILTQSLSKVIGTDPDTGKSVYGTLTDPVKREQAFINAFNTSGVTPGPDTIEMLSKAGYTADEIAKYQQKYPEAFQPAA